jgi:hypothetical protein
MKRVDFVKKQMEEKKRREGKELDRRKKEDRKKTSNKNKREEKKHTYHILPLYPPAPAPTSPHTCSPYTFQAAHTACMCTGLRRSTQGSRRAEDPPQ